MSSRALKILIIDDEPTVLEALELLFELNELPSARASSPDEACARVAEGGIGVVLQDMNFAPGETTGERGVTLFRALREQDPELPVLLMTAFASLETAVQLVKEGANDYIAKPWDDEKLVATVRNLLEMRRLQLENRRLQSEGRAARDALADEYALCGLIYESPTLHRLVTTALAVARSSAPVLITGPSGAGKEKIAEIVEANSQRHGAPFVRLNLGALPPELLESELFGAERGAFTGATRSRTGRLEAADDGTVFLDEVDSLPLAGQVKLLRVLQSGEFQRLGSPETRRVDLRVISATNAELPALVQAGRFREDLYYRLNVVELRVPGLDQRREDVLPLARHFLAAVAQEEGLPELRLDASAQEALLAHSWRGHVRELLNLVHRAALTVEGTTLGARDLALEGAESRGAQPDAARELGPLDAERHRIEAALVAAEGIVARAADELGMSRQALYRRMDKLGIVLERRPRR